MSQRSVERCAAIAEERGRKVVRRGKEGLAQVNVHLACPLPPRPVVASAPTTFLMQPAYTRYEMRREAQAIVPNLFLGPFQASTNLRRLREKGITHM